MRYLLLNEITDCIGIVRGASSIVTGIGREKVLAEHTRGELRCKISSVVECLSDFQSILNGIQNATIVGSARAAV